MGCSSSKAVDVAAPAAVATEQKAEPVVAETVQEVKGGVIIVYEESTSLESLANAVAEGAKAAGSSVALFKVTAETTLEQLPKADAIVFGVTSSGGFVSSPVKTLLDSTGLFWREGKLVGKLASIFVASEYEQDGQESTALSLLPMFAHHGMMFLPFGFQHGPVQFDMEALHAGTAYGAGTYTGSKENPRAVSAQELEVATKQGEFVAKTAAALVKGRAALAQ